MSSPFPSLHIHHPPRLIFPSHESTTRSLLSHHSFLFTFPHPFSYPELTLNFTPIHSPLPSFPITHVSSIHPPYHSLLFTSPSFIQSLVSPMNLTSTPPFSSHPSTPLTSLHFTSLPSFYIPFLSHQHIYPLPPSFPLLTELWL